MKAPTAMTRTKNIDQRNVLDVVRRGDVFCANESMLCGG